MKTTVDNTYGVLLIALLISSTLYGVGLLQFWMYTRRYHSKDPRLVKYLVIAVLTCDTFQQALLSHAVYKYLVTSMRDPLILPSVVKTVIVQLFFSCAIATLVQQFYCWRIYKSSWKKYIVGGGRVISQLGVMYGVTGLFRQVNNIPFSVRLTLLSEVITLEAWGIASNVLSAATDLTISAVLVILLHSVKTGFKRSTDVINRLMIFTFNTGLPTSTCAVVSTISIVVSPNTFLYIFFFLLMGRLYTNSMLVTLNSRKYINSPSDHSTRDQYSLGNVDRPTVPQTGDHPITIRIDTVHGTHEDLKSSSQN